MSIPASRPLRPFLPRIDPFAQSIPVLSGELTPASSHGSFAASPLSASSERRSPFLRPPRKVSAPPIQGPPSPELLSQDCAFPPFPLNRNRSKDNSPRESVRGRARTPDSTRHFEQEAKRSASSGPSRSGRRQGTSDSSRPSTAASSRQASVSSRIGSRKGSSDRIPPMPSLRPTTSPHSSASDPERKEIEKSIVWPQFNDVSDTDYPELSMPNTFAKPSPQQSTNGHEPTSVEYPFPLDRNPDPSLPQTQLGTQSSRQPLYKSKRPPPINSNISLTPDPVPEKGSEVPKTPKTPSTPTSSLARTLTGLFRKRGLSTNKKNAAKMQANEGPRFVALSLEPDPQEIIRSPDPLPRPVSPQVEVYCPQSEGYRPKDEAYPQMPNVQKVVQASAGVTQPTQHFPEPSQAQISEADDIDESSHHDEQQGASPVEDDVEQSLGAADLLSKEGSPVEEEDKNLNRASIDSASSYGSVGFSRGSESSRSTNQGYLHSQMSSISTARTASSMGDSLATTSSRFQTFENVFNPYNDPGNPYGDHGNPYGADSVQQNQQTVASGALVADVECNGKERMPTMPPISELPVDSRTPSAIQMSRHPSNVGTSRGTCRGCKKAILSGEKSISSKDGRLSGKYHKECFSCTTCHTPFATADFYVHEDNAYCAHDYHVLNKTLCEGCGKGIEGQYLETSTISGQAAKKFHPQCLRCGTCKVQLHEDYFELNGRVYCERDAFRMASMPKSPYDTAPSRPSPLNREYINSLEPPQGLTGGRFPERRLTKLMTTY